MEEERGNLTDTIAAIATARGRGALAVLRVSGPRAKEVLARVAPDRVFEPELERRPVMTRIVDPDDRRLLDRALVTLFPGPGSYTGEDLVEISTHGGALVPALVLSALERAGARLARPGEFTQRAYLNGKLDLVQAEAVRDVIDAPSQASHRAAIHQMEGGLSRRLASLRQELVGLEALLAHHVDFPEEDEPPVSLQRVAGAAREIEASLQVLLDTASEGELLRDGALVVLAGRPNSGKSSLFNALLGEARAIVNERPGTTRDALESRVSFEELPFRLVDTAGIRESGDEVETLGIEVARRYLAGAHVVLLCASGEWGWGHEEAGFLDGLSSDTPVVVLWTKSDRWSGAAPTVPGALGPRVHAVVTTSALGGTGLSELRRVLTELVYAGIVEAGAEAPLLTRRRQVDGVRHAAREVRAFVEAIEQGVPAEMASTHLRPAETALEELLGIISPDDVLDRVFADFCIGK